MNILVLPIACLVSLSLAEPPVGDGYPAARTSDHHHNDHNDHHDHTPDHDRPLSQEYGPPSFAQNSISNEYGAPSARNSPNNLEQTLKHTLPKVRVSYNQRFSSAASRNSGHVHPASNSVGQGYAATNARRQVSQKYHSSESRSLSQENGALSTPARSLSTEYGAPVARTSQKNSNFHNKNSLAEDYSAPSSQSRTVFQSSHTVPLARTNPSSYPKSYDSPSQSFGTPKSVSSTYGAPSPATSYGAPSSRNSDSDSQDDVSQLYTALTEGDLSETYGVPNARSLSQEYGVPSSRSNLKADDVVSADAFTRSRSAPSSSYLPAARDAPSEQYGVPEQDSQGYENSRARALEELLNQEPANYDFAYQIEDQESGSDFGHSETRSGNKAEGSYFVVLPDGSKQTVDYEADERGYKPRISVEPASGGYDGNAQDLSRSSQGPY